MKIPHQQHTVSGGRHLSDRRSSMIRLRTRSACAACKREHAHYRPCRRCCMRGQSQSCVDAEKKIRTTPTRLSLSANQLAQNAPSVIGDPCTILYQDPFLAQEETTFLMKEETTSGPHNDAFHMDRMSGLQDHDVTSDAIRHPGDSSPYGLPQTAPAYLDEGLPPSLWLDNWFIERMFTRLIDGGVFTIEEGRTLMTRIAQSIGRRIKELQTFITIEQRRTMMEQHVRSMRYISDNCAPLPVPSIVWMSCCIVVHANEAFRNLTAYNEMSPSKLEDLSILNLLDHSTIRKFISTLFKEGVMTTGTCHKSMPASVRYLRDTSTERYIQGTLTLSITRDIFGLPTFYTAHFLPLPSLLGEFPFVLDEVDTPSVQSSTHNEYTALLRTSAITPVERPKFVFYSPSLTDRALVLHHILTPDRLSRAMIRNVIIMTSSGVVIFEKVWVEGDSKTQEKGRLFGSLITTMSEFSRQSTGGMCVSYLEFNEVAISIVDNSRSKLICTLFHDGSDYGNVIAYCILRSFIESFSAELSSFGVNFNTTAFVSFGTKIIDAISNSVKMVVEQLQANRGIANALVVFDDGTAISSATSDEENVGTVANLQPIISLSNDILQTAKKEAAHVISLTMGKHTIKIDRISDARAVLVCVCKNHIQSSSYVPNILKSLHMLQKIFATSHALNTSNKF
ncbi:hypothetical protein PROFUN_13454 [Planoprotostelium fungivorum]|uniref:Uncharacterized protein n=1 Tax=Planoprotostelium fungivorum TaxID=1890364 RepID=A0A2P6N407_9EUKA|nr:hypothetical protein PROFUN_13454 [Planoprotostelium fungivorum]